MAVAPYLSGKAWADLDTQRLADLLDATRQEGWREALSGIEKDAPFFVKRMRNLALGNWHMLLLHDRADRALDVGCGFGSLPLGLAQYYRETVGVEFLPNRIAYASTRAAQDRRTHCRFVRASGHILPFTVGSFGLVTLNGVLEWAGVYAEGNPRELQLRMLRETRRVLTPGGHLAVAIENRFAMESLLGLPDTHTGVIWPTVFPRWVANAMTRLRTGTPYRTYLYHPASYRRLFHAAGFESARVFDLISSYNDYDFVVDVDDVASYRFLFQQDRVRSFFRLAGRVRQTLSRVWPGALPRVGYANLVIGGATTSTILDATHPLWQALAATGAQPGRHRFGCQGEEAGQLSIVSHDGDRVTGMIELGTTLPADDASITIPARVYATFGSNLRPATRLRIAGVECRVHLPAAN